MVKRGNSPSVFTLVSSHLEYCVQFQAPSNDVKVLGSIQGRPTKLVKGLESMYYEERLKTLEMASMEVRRFGRVLMALCSFLGRSTAGGANLCSQILTS